MKVLLLNGSPKANGNTALALKEMEKVFHEQGIETRWVHVGNKRLPGCFGCGRCKTKGKCIIEDLVNETAALFEEADGIVAGTPVYYAGANSTLISYLTRLFYSTSFDKRFKVAAGVAAARRGGLTSTYDELNKFFAIAGMPIATGQYWNGIHGAAPGEALDDAEGLQQMRTLAASMSFLIKSIALGKEQIGIPEKEAFIRTNFIR